MWSFIIGLCIILGTFLFPILTLSLVLIFFGHTTIGGILIVCSLIKGLYQLGSE
jgi:hypothetical protein